MTAKIDFPVYKVGATYRNQVIWNSNLLVESFIHNSGVISVRCKKPHQLVDGQLVSIKNVVPAEFNIENVAVVVIDSRTFNYNISVSSPLALPSFFNDSSCLVPVDLTGCTASWTLLDKNKIQIFEASFSPDVVITALEGKIELELQDFETSGFPEITVTNPVSHLLKVFHPNGDTTFLAEGFLTETFGVPANILSTDLNFIILTSSQGAPGTPGLPGSGVGIPLTFSWGDATPALIGIVPAGKIVYKVEVNVLVAFDVVSTLSVGDVGDHERVFDIGSVDLSAVGSYQTNPTTTYGSLTNINLYLTPGVGNTQGSGLILLYIQE